AHYSLRVELVVGYWRVFKKTPESLLAGAQLLFGVLVLGDVPAAAYQPDDGPLFVSQGRFRRGQPSPGAGWICGWLLSVHQRLTRPADQLFVGIIIGSQLPREEVEVRLSHDLLSPLGSQGADVRHVVDDKMALNVFDEDVVRQVVDQSADEVAIFYQQPRRKRGGFIVMYAGCRIRHRGLRLYPQRRLELFQGMTPKRQLIAGPMISSTRARRLRSIRVWVRSQW